MDLECMVANYWWEQKENERKIHQVGWNTVCMSKFHEDLVFKNLNHSNLAMIVKQGQRIVEDEFSLLHKVYKARCFPYSSFFESQLGNSLSYAWRGIWETRKWLYKGCKWQIGAGKHVKIWRDPWIPGFPIATVPFNTPSLDPLEATIDQFIDRQTHYCKT